MTNLDSNVIRIAGYVVVALLVLSNRPRERRRVNDVDGVWPTFWVLTCGFLMAMAVARAVDAGELLSSLGRSAADEGGWYRSRRPFQASVVGTVGVVWLAVIVVALWRTPERRRRYLPVGLMVSTVAAFAGVRVVSLHQVDTLLYRTDALGIRLATVVEFTLLGLTALATRWMPPGSAAQQPAEPGPDALASRQAGNRA